jgi:hypothetical protein
MRIRTIKPEFWTHPVMSRLDDATRLLAIGLLNLADDEGFFFADERLIRSALRPFDDDSSIVRRSIEKLAKAGYIGVREHDSHGPVGFVVSFADHQRVDRPKPSSIKDLYDSTINRRMIDDESLLEGKGREGNREGKGTGKVSTSTEGFDEFWSAYPKKTGRGDAEKIWAKMRPPLDDVLTALGWQRQQQSWVKDKGQFIPMPSTWLNQKRWLDEPTAPVRTDNHLAF